MSSGQLDEKAIFDVARKIETEEARLQYLKQVCGDDHVLLDRVVALARIHDEQRKFSGIATRSVAATIDPSRDRRTSRLVIGPYKLIEQIGEGGMGLVYMARAEGAGQAEGRA